MIGHNSGAADIDAFAVVRDRLSHPTEVLTAQIWISLSRQLQKMDPEALYRLVDSSPEEICDMVEKGELR